MSQRLTRKEIKQDIREDEFRGYMLRVFEFVQERPRVVAGGAFGVVALVLVLAGLLTYLDSRSNKASEELADAIEIANAPLTGDDAATDDESPVFASADERTAEARKAFEQVRGSVGSSIAGDVADLYLADIAIEEGDTERARQIWEAFLAQHEDHLLALSVRVNLIHLDRQSGRAQEVADDLQQALEQSKKTLPEDVILFELGQTLEVLDQQEAAFDIYQRIIDDHPRSPYTAKARQITTAAS
ncbi:MAG: tetratricopeptide repeat protein [Acidobacteriota bacterium]